MSLLESASPDGVTACEAELQAEKAALRWLFTFADQERGVGWNPAASADEQWKLGRTRRLLDLAGFPDQALTCILIAGTKGKGSTAAFLASILSAAGVKAGLYTKPHLQIYRERIRVDGQLISRDDFIHAVESLRGVVAELTFRYPDAGAPTTFELTTVLALRHFARTGCAVAVIEVGLGGRLDATNAVSPLVSVITPIGYDHTAVLGSRLASIAREKAGIMRRGVVCLSAEQRASAEKALRAAARASGATYHTIPPLPPEPGGPTESEAPQHVPRPGSGEDQPRAVRLPLAGDHQRQNAALALAAAGAISSHGFAVAPEAMAAGLTQLSWPGRFEVIQRDRPIVLDGAHNESSARALARTLSAWLTGRPLDLIIGLNNDKDALAILRYLVPLAAHVYATAAPGQLRALAPSVLQRLCAGLSAEPVTVLTASPSGLIETLHLVSSRPVCVTGSLALVGAARTALGLPPPDRLWPPLSLAPDGRVVGYTAHCAAAIPAPSAHYGGRSSVG